MMERLIDVACKMEVYLTADDLTTLLNEKRRLWDIIIEENQKIRKSKKLVIM